MGNRKNPVIGRIHFANFLVVGLAAGFVLAMSLYSCSTPSHTVGNQLTTTTSSSANVSSMEGLKDLQNSFRAISSRVLPATVKVDVIEIQTQQAPGGTTPPLFDFFFGKPDQGGNQQQFQTEGLGSGVIVRHDGSTYYVLTNAHVAGQASSIQVTLNDGRKFAGKLVGADTRMDLALVSFQSTATDIAVATLGDSNTVHVGDWVLAIGSPYGLQSTVTAGIISALHRRGGPDGNISDFIQTDAAINRGNSGGPLVDLNGDVIGINTWITSQTGGSIGLGFAIPIDNVKKAIGDFIAKGKVVYGWLGVQISDVSEELAKQMNVDSRNGAIIRNVFRGSPADKAGLLPGDFVTAINGQDIHNSDDLNIAIGNLPVGQKGVFKVIRDGKPVELTAVIEERLPDSQIANLNRRLWPGLTVYPLTPDILKQVKLAADVKGVIVISVDPQTPASVAGLRPGDVITKLNGTTITNGMEFYAALNDMSKKDLMIGFLRDGAPMSVGLVRP